MASVQSGFPRLARAALGLLGLFGLGLIAGCTTQASINGTYEHFYVSDRYSSSHGGYELTTLKNLAECNRLIYPDKPFTLSLNHVFLRYLQSFDGEILVYAETTMPERPDVLKPQRRILAYKRGQGHKTDIGFVDPVIYGPAPAPHYPLSVRLIVAELDKKDNLHLANLIKTAAATVATAQPEAGPGANLVAQLGDYLVQMNTDDLEFDVTYTFYPSWADKSTANPAERNKLLGGLDECGGSTMRQVVLPLAEQTLVTVKTEIPSRHLPPEDFSDGFANTLTWPLWVYFPGYLFSRPPNEDSMNRNEDTASLVLWDGHYLRFRHSGRESNDYPFWPKQNPLILNVLFLIPRALLVPGWQSPWWPQSEPDDVLYHRLELDQKIAALEEKSGRLEKSRQTFLRERKQASIPPSTPSKKDGSDAGSTPLSTKTESADLALEGTRRQILALHEDIGEIEARQREAFQQVLDLKRQKQKIEDDLTTCNIHLSQISTGPFDETTTETVIQLKARKGTLEQDLEKANKKIVLYQNLEKDHATEVRKTEEVLKVAERQEQEQRNRHADAYAARADDASSSLTKIMSDIALIEQQRGLLVDQQRAMSKSVGQVRANGKYQTKTYAALTVSRAPESIPPENYQAILDSSQEYLDRTLTSAADQKLARDLLLSKTTDLFAAVEEERRNAEERLQQADGMFLNDREVADYAPEEEQQANAQSKARSVAELFVNARKEAASSGLVTQLDGKDRESATRSAEKRIERQAADFFSSRLGFSVSWDQIQQFAKDPQKPFFGWDPKRQSFIPTKFLPMQSDLH